MRSFNTETNALLSLPAHFPTDLTLICLNPILRPV